MADPYETLGVRKGDDEDAIRRAYRKLAKRYHPDLNPGKPEALARFQEINAANDILSDPEKRARFDRGEIDADGREAPPPRPYYRQGPQGRGEQPGLDDILGAFRAGGFGGFGGGGPRRGSDVQYALTVDFLDAAKGATQRLALPDGRTLDVKIPPGTRDGHVLRLRGQGSPGGSGAPAGDALIEVSVAPHPFFSRDGDDVVLRLPVTLREAVLGGPVDVPTLTGTVRLTIPANSVGGARLRLKGRGIGGGHQYVVLEVVLPSRPEPALAAFLRGWVPEHEQDARAALRDAS